MTTTNICNHHLTTTSNTITTIVTRTTTTIVLTVPQSHTWQYSHTHTHTTVVRTTTTTPTDPSPKPRQPLQHARPHNQPPHYHCTCNNTTAPTVTQSYTHYHSRDHHILTTTPRLSQPQIGTIAIVSPTPPTPKLISPRLHLLQLHRLRSSITWNMEITPWL